MHPDRSAELLYILYMVYRAHGLKNNAAGVLKADLQKLSELYTGDL